MNKASNTTNFRQSLGKMGERVAQKYLTAQGWTIERCNFYAHRLGEIDIIATPPTSQAMIAKSEQMLSFIEVKTRHQALKQNCAFEHSGQQAVHWQKQKRIRQAAMTYVHALIKANCEAGRVTPHFTLRFDVMLVDIHLNYRDLQALVELQDSDALAPHCGINLITQLMGNFG